VDTSRFPVDAHPITADEGAKQCGTNGTTQVKAAPAPIWAEVEKAPRTAHKFVGTDIEPNQKSRALFRQLDAIGGLYDEPARNEALGKSSSNFAGQMVSATTGVQHSHIGRQRSGLVIEYLSGEGLEALENLGYRSIGKAVIPPTANGSFGHQPAVNELEQVFPRSAASNASNISKLASRYAVVVLQGEKHVHPRRIACESRYSRYRQGAIHISVVAETIWSINLLSFLWECEKGDDKHV